MHIPHHAIITFTFLIRKFLIQSPVRLVHWKIDIRRWAFDVSSRKQTSKIERRTSEIESKIPCGKQLKLLALGPTLLGFCEEP